MNTELDSIIREAVKATGRSANKLARDVGVSQPTMSAFLLGHDIKLSTASKLVAFLGLELKAAGKPAEVEVGCG